MFRNDGHGVIEVFRNDGYGGELLLPPLEGGSARVPCQTIVWQGGRGRGKLLSKEISEGYKGEFFFLPLIPRK